MAASYLQRPSKSHHGIANILFRRIPCVSLNCHQNPWRFFLHSYRQYSHRKYERYSVLQLQDFTHSYAPLCQVIPGVDPLKYMKSLKPNRYLSFHNFLLANHSIFSSNHKVDVRILVRPFEYIMPTPDSECMFLSFFHYQRCMDQKTEIGTYLLQYNYLLHYLFLLTFGTNDANIWEHGAAMNLSLIFRKMPVTHN